MANRERTLSLIAYLCFLATTNVNASGHERPPPQPAMTQCITSIYGIYRIMDPDRLQLIGNAVAVDAHTLVTHCIVAQADTDLITDADEKVTITELKHISNKKDLCLLDVPYREVHPPAMRTSDSLKVGETAVGIGKILTRRPVVSSGNIKNIIKSGTNTIIEAHTEMQPIETGGGLYDKDCNLIGITYFDSKAPEKTLAIPTERVTEELNNFKKEPAKS